MAMTALYQAVSGKGPTLWAAEEDKAEGSRYTAITSLQDSLKPSRCL